MNSLRLAARALGIAAAIAAVTALVQGVRLPAVLDGPTLHVALGRVADPHLLTGWLDRAVLAHCSLAASCVQHWNLAIFGLVVFAVGAFAFGRTLGLLATAACAISPLAVAAIVDPLGASLSIGIFFAIVAAIDVARARVYPPLARCAVAIALALADPALVPASLAYGAFGGPAPFACAVVAIVLRFFLVRPTLDPLATSATVVAFGAFLFVGGPLLGLAVRYRAFGWLEGGGRDLFRATGFAVALLLGAMLATSGDVAPYWLAAEGTVLVGLLAGLRAAPATKAFERSTIGLAGLFVLQYALFIQHHGDGTTAAIAFRGDDLRGMLASSARPACVVHDQTAERYVLADGAFLQLYPPEVAPALTRETAGCLAMPAATTIVTMVGLAVNDWGQAQPLMQAFRDATDVSGVLQIEGGKVDPATHALTPTGRGAFGNQFETPLGRVGDFTILPGFAYTPKCIAIGAHKRLVFAAASVPGSPSLDIDVTAKTATGTHVLLSGTFPESPTRRPYQWRRYALPVGADDCTSFTFSVAGARTGAGAWLTFAGAAIR